MKAIIENRWGKLKQILLNRRHQNNKSSLSISQTMGVTNISLCNWEKGHRMPNTSALIAWADTLGLELTLIPKERQYLYVLSENGIFEIPFDNSITFIDALEKHGFDLGRSNFIISKQRLTLKTLNNG